ncbi:Quinolinate synthase A [Fundidesulfovibrio magnetotacticus]|uniref:quinolinate synthase n=1 Tax=Fundidesulfovibrio magnetotacticus TaxID=2730080 RepID=A0A6V8LXH1_9BACT|nr:quinolinate synthase NadA [Fundidesulfovibrio magnetotacticus]GFK94347.1 Quinolinate synthase A [Fundidesulfovibrio magnetotacticus]
MSDSKDFDTIESVRARLGKDLVILAHHYMSDAVARHADHTGDSLELSRRVPGLEARYIVFCGVFFMAETAAILAKPGQKVLIPEMNSRCVMSDMAPAWLAAKVLDRLEEGGLTATPLTYVNSSAAVKALVGARGGSVCTSANAKTMLSWAMARGGHTLFLPDVRLGLNAADWIALPKEDRNILDIREHGQAIDLERARRAKLLLWPGQCVIHSRFKPESIRKARAESPGCLVVVHPECHPNTVALADACGSTSLIIRFVAEAPEGSTVYVGTEFNLVNRLAQQYSGVKVVRPLLHSTCSNMEKITEPNLARLLENLDGSPSVEVDEALKEPAKLALQRMLDACAPKKG